MISKEKVARFYNKDVYQYNLKNTAGMQVSVLNYGGIITKILFYDKIIITIIKFLFLGR